MDDDVLSHISYFWKLLFEATFRSYFGTMCSEDRDIVLFALGITVVVVVALSLLKLM